MSQENVDVVRRIYVDGLIDRDPEWILDLATPDIEYVNPPNAVEPGVRRGPAEVVRAMRKFAEPWRESRHELHELFDCGNAVVASVTWYTRVRGSATELTQEEAHTWTLRGGRIAGFEWGQDLSRALDQQGYSPDVGPDPSTG
jgi:ketosteroid isomerase-like protein